MTVIGAALRFGIVRGVESRNFPIEVEIHMFPSDASATDPVGSQRPCTRSFADAASRTRSVALVSIAALVLGACADNTYQAPPPPTVTGAQPAVADVVRFIEYTGTTRAVAAVTVRARVEGFLESMYFEPGRNVKKGDPLFLIDPEPFELELKAANANVTSRRAELDLAQTEFERTRSLYRSKTTSEIKFIQSRARRDTATAELALAEANARAAQLNVEYANVTSPLDGRVGRNLVDIGNLVGAGEATPLVDVLDYSPLYVYFYISERDVLDLQATGFRNRKARGVDYEHRARSVMYVGRANEEGYPHAGEIDYSALEIDAETGTFEIRGILDNEGSLDQIIVPGSFVRVQVPIGLQSDALLVPESALGADQNGRYVLVAGDDGLVEQRSVTVGAERRDGLRVIDSGISANDWVITKGLQRARPGAKVTMEKATTPMPAAQRAISPHGTSDPDPSTARDDTAVIGDEPTPADGDATEEPSDAPAPAVVTPGAGR
jgi:RND family efflux transporter MFP subunit